MFKFLKYRPAKTDTRVTKYGQGSDARVIKKGTMLEISSYVNTDSKGTSTIYKIAPKSPDFDMRDHWATWETEVDSSKKKEQTTSAPTKDEINKRLAASVAELSDKEILAKLSKMNKELESVRYASLQYSSHNLRSDINNAYKVYRVAAAERGLSWKNSSGITVNKKIISPKAVKSRMPRR